MAYHHSNNTGIDTGSNSLLGGGSGISGVAEYSGDERESRSGGEERPDSGDLQDKPIYLLEHLATFTVNKDSGIIYPADGMRRLLQLEKTTGIWSQKMQLCLDYQWVLIMDYETGNIIERFPATLIQEPTAFTSTDAMELYNNILVFIVSGRSGSRSEMHIFQSQSVSAVHLVEDLKNLRSGKMMPLQREVTQHLQHQSHISTANAGGQSKSMLTAASSAMHNRTEQQQRHHHHRHLSQQNSSGGMDHLDMRNSGNGGGMGEISHSGAANVSGGDSGGDGVGGGNGETDSEHGGQNDETSSTSSDKYERDVTVLNHCFDDIEKFIARLQHAAAASRELERRRRNRKTKKKDPGEGLLTLRTRPPHEKEFIDIFAKFKLSFNLLAKLKAHIHDPNAPELVHFLFTPLALIVEASSDAYYESQLPARVINPLLTREAINLLINCVTSKETELWRSLGDAWIIPRDQWKEEVGSYHPVFLDGWSPDYVVIDELEPESSTLTNINKRRTMDSQATVSGIRFNGRGGVRGTAGMMGIDMVAGGGMYDEYDGSALTDKYTIHHGHTNERGEGAGLTTNAGTANFSTRSEISVDSIERSGVVTGHSNSLANNSSGNAGVANQAGVMHSISTGIQNLHTRGEGRNYGMGGNGGGTTTQSELTATRSNVGGGEGTNASVVDSQILEGWLDDLQAAGAKIVLVTYPRTANNDKELSVVRGEYLEILDDTRKWWKARNIRGQVAHVPHTIVALYNYGDSEAPSNSFYGQQQQPHQYPNYKARHATENIEQPQRSGDAADWIRNKNLGKKGEFRYF